MPRHCSVSSSNQNAMENSNSVFEEDGDFDLAAEEEKVHEQSKRDQFLMKLRFEFEITRSNLMNRDPFPSLDVCFGELLREEQRLLTQGIFK
ncbi:uncharacterized protein LOC112326270 isoform X2 [Populus trichocarpa]|uniref:uncharacterized protein LOC112326270 isoform X2 n=1 Tax=Populus trichocarpa TaxID=3694 RepID=UPI002279E5E1|nr:uncharacterized protein LOC112326270 isoform X2 [Populus trichocarpa]